MLTESKFAKIQHEITLALDSKKERRIQKLQQPLEKTFWSEDVEPKPTIRKAHAQPTNNNNLVQQKIEPQPAKTITWVAAKDKPTSQIINAVGQNRFTLFNLTKEDFHTDECFTKFKNLITINPKVVPQLANQGLVHSKKFGGTLKAKALGLFGNARVYATKREIADTGETLYIFDHVDSKAH